MKHWLICLLIALVAFNIGYTYSVTPTKLPIEKATQSSVAVSVSGGQHFGSGVILRSGYILSAKHIFDENDNKIIDNEERYGVLIVDSDGEKREANILWPRPDINRDTDVVVLASDYVNPSDVRVEDKNPSVGDLLFSLTFPASSDFPHLFIGNKSYDEHSDRDRASMQVFYGSSGGGVLNRDGNAIGVIVSMRNSQGELVPLWSEYVPMRIIRSMLSRDKMEYMLDDNAKADTKLQGAIVGLVTLFSCSLLSMFFVWLWQIYAE